jgi:long-chain acyl-CoA synthetase
LLRGVSQDRLDYLGEEYFQYILKPRLNPKSVARLRELTAEGRSVVLVSQGLDHVMRPMAGYLGVRELISNRLEFRDGLSTGRLLSPVIRPRGGLARITGRRVDGRISRDHLARDLGFAHEPTTLDEAVFQTRRPSTQRIRPVVVFDSDKHTETLSVRQALAGKQILLIGMTGFIGKVWLAKMLRDLPEIGKIYLLIRRQRSTSAQQRFEKIVQESPVFVSFHDRYGDKLSAFLGDRIEVVEGDVTKPGLGIEEKTLNRLAGNLDLVVNSSGLTDFNPDLRAALAINVDATQHAIDFIRRCDHAGLLHLSTCYVVGTRDGRIREHLHPEYTPAGVATFDSDEELRSLKTRILEVEADADGSQAADEIRQQILAKANGNGKRPTDSALETKIRKLRGRWVRNRLAEYGMQRAREFGWPNTYTFTKSLAESLIAKHGSDLPIAIVRPSIVETSTRDPFPGWNEGVNTSAPISYLLGTYFRQLPSNGRKCLDLIPVDLVCRGITLIGAAVVRRAHDRVYQLATSGSNPCDMRRSVELTGLAHRKYLRGQELLRHRLRARFDSIPVSKERYQNLSAPRQRALIQAIQRMSAPFPLKRPPLAQLERGLDRVERLIELYEPFILHNEQVFEANNVELLSSALPPDELEAFGYDASLIDWWEYWINIHIPALRKWSYPLIEGRPVETGPRREFSLPMASPGNGGVGETVSSATR